MAYSYGDIENAFERIKRDVDHNIDFTERQNSPKKVEPLKPKQLGDDKWRGVGDFSEKKFTASQVGKSGLGHKVSGIGFGIGMGIDTMMNLHDGDDLGTAAVKGAFTGMLYATMPTLMFAKDMAGLGVAAYSGYTKWNREKKQWWNNQFLPNFGGSYQDTRRAQTMRQAAVEAIQGSKMNARSALGGEAKIFSQNFNRG